MQSKLDKEKEIEDLKKEPDSVLAKMFQPGLGFAARREVDGATWINANPKIFAIILDWLKYKNLFIPTNITIRSVIGVADYFCLNEMINALREREEEETRVKRERVERIIEAIRQTRPVPYPVYPYVPNPPRPGPGPFPRPPGPGPFPGPDFLPGQH